MVDEAVLVVAKLLKQMYPQNPDIVLGREARRIVQAMREAGCAIVVGNHDRALDAAVDAVIRDWALFRSPRSGGTELVRSEVHEIIGQAVRTYAEYADA